MVKTKIFITLCIIVFIAFPFVLNMLLLHPCIFDIVGDGTIWLNFWPVYLSAIASVIMIVLTYKMLKQSQQQMIEMQKQKFEDERARLVFSFTINECAYFLKISNIGKNNAFDISVSINSDFISEIEAKHQCLFRDLKKPFFIEAGKSVYVFMGFCEETNNKLKGKDIIFIAQGTYNRKYTINEKIELSQIINKRHFVVRSQAESSLYYMKKGMVVQNNSYMPIQRSLDAIARNIDKMRTLLQNITKDQKDKNDVHNETSTT